MATHCIVPVRGKRIRVTQVDVCGAVLPSAQYVATDGFISVTLTSEIEEGTEIIVRNAAGALCVNEKVADSFKRFTVEIEFCGVNPSLLVLMTNAEPYLDAAGDVAGFTVPEGEINKAFALELWTGLTGQACLPGQTDEASGYILLPFVLAGVLGDITIDGENAVTFSLTGAATKGGNTWGVGPYDVVRDAEGAPSPLPTALDPSDHLLIVDTALAPPPSACDPSPVTPITGVTPGTPGTFAPTGVLPPANLAALKADPVIGDVGNDGEAAWTTGQYVVLGDASEAHWDGTAWVVGRAV